MNQAWVDWWVPYAVVCLGHAKVDDGTSHTCYSNLRRRLADADAAHLGQAADAAGGGTAGAPHRGVHSGRRERGAFPRRATAVLPYVRKLLTSAGLGCSRLYDTACKRAKDERSFRSSS